MPISLAKHRANLTAFGVRERPLIRCEPSRADGGRLTTLDGRVPVRSAARERDVLQEYWGLLPAEHRSVVTALADALPPLGERCRLSVVIPARDESTYLARALEVLAAQTDHDYRPLPADAFEVLVLNGTEPGDPPDATLDVLEKTKARLGLTNVHGLHLDMCAGERFPLTLADRCLTDLTVLRVLRRRGPLPHYFACADADLIWADPRYLWAHVTELERSPWLDGLRAGLDHCPWIIARSDLIMFSRITAALAEHQFSQHALRPENNPDFNFAWNRVRLSGPASVLSLEAYAVAGGYTPDRRIGNDVDLGERLSVARGRTVGGRFVPQTWSVRRTRHWVQTSPRRWFLMAADGVFPYARDNDYAAFYSRESIAATRDPSHRDLLVRAEATARLADANRDRFDDELNARWQLVKEVRHDPVVAEQQLAAALSWLGLRQGRHWEIRDDQARLTDLAPLAQRLEGLRRRWLDCMPVRAQARPGGGHPLWWRYV